MQASEQTELFKNVEEMTRQPGVREAMNVFARWQQVEAIYAAQQQFLLGMAPSTVAASANFPPVR